MHAVSIVRVSYRLRIGFRKWIASGIARIASSIASRISSKSRTGSFTPAFSRTAPLCPAVCKKKANIRPSLSVGHRNGSLAMNVAGVARNGYTGASAFARTSSTGSYSPTHNVGFTVPSRCLRTTVIENVEHRVVHPQRSLALSALALRLLDASSFQCYPRVIPTVRLFCKRCISHLRC